MYRNYKAKKAKGLVSLSKYARVVKTKIVDGGLKDITEPYFMLSTRRFDSDQWEEIAPTIFEIRVEELQKAKEAHQKNIEDIDELLADIAKLLEEA